MATVTYKWPVAGLTAPTAAQMFGHNELIAEVAPALYDTAIVITHNMNISAADRASGFPEVDFMPSASATQFLSATPFVSAQGANTTTVTVTDPVTEFADTFDIVIRRPQSKFK